MTKKRPREVDDAAGGVGGAPAVGAETPRNKASEDGRPLSLRPMFAMMDSLMREERAARERRAAGGTTRTALTRHMVEQCDQVGMNGLSRIQRCRVALDALDRRGWDRSFHQRLFHEEYLKSCARIFFKRDGLGAFARNHNRVLEMNGWDSTPQEILVSTPRRFGKTISVSMFAAAIIFSAPNIEMSIYSTCKRISQKLLRNIVKFLDLIYLELEVPRYKVLRMNSEEIHIGGPEGHGDVRVVNSYPSKIGARHHHHHHHHHHSVVFKWDHHHSGGRVRSTRGTPHK